MNQSHLQVPRSLSVAQFLDFLESRPDEEKWELIDGSAIMTAPPIIGHQRIARNLERALNDRLEQARPEWIAEIEVGIELAGVSHFRPEPDVMVIDAAINPRQRYADRFHLVAEILSDSDRLSIVEAKLAYYQAHACNQAILLIRQDRMHVTVIARRENGWVELQLTAPGDMLDIDGVGPVCSLARLYRGAFSNPNSAVNSGKSDLG